MQVEFAEMISKYGMTTIVCGLFVWQYLKQIKYNEEREEKLYSVIDTMSQTLPQISEKINEILEYCKKGV